MKISIKHKRRETEMWKLRKVCSSRGVPKGEGTVLLCACDECRPRLTSHPVGKHFWKIRKRSDKMYGSAAEQKMRRRKERRSED